MPLSAPHRPVTDVLFSVESGARTEPSDDVLLEAIAGGDRQAFTILMRRYVSKMVVLAQRVVFDREQAQEIAQEAFLRVWLHAGKWDPHGTATFHTWLRRITVNLAISRRRRRREQVDIEAIEDLPAMQADGFDSVASSHQKRTVREALLHLPERQRAALALYYFDDIPQAEAAEAMQLSLKAFDSLLVRARRNLKKYLAARGFLPKGDIA